MKKVQEQIDSVRFRGNDFLFENDDEENNNTGAVTEAELPIIPAIDFGLMALKRDTRKVKNHKSKDFLFQNYDYSADEIPKKKKLKDSEALFGSSVSHQGQQDRSSNNQEVDKPEPKNLIQDEDYMSELNGLNLNPTQHSDIESFLNQINDHPKPFIFDVEPLMQSKLSEIRSGTLQQDQKQEDLLPKKYFEFDTKKKRELPKYLNEVEHIKNDLISEYKNNYINLYKNSIDSDKYKYQLDSINKRQKNDFLDQFYLLNDGRIELDNFLKNPPVDSNGRLINSKDLELDLKLNKEFEDSEYEKDLIFKNDRDQFEDQSVKNQKSAKTMKNYY